MFFHALLHGPTVHYAQLATLARHNGVKPDWLMDYLAVNIEQIYFDLAATPASNHRRSCQLRRDFLRLSALGTAARMHP